MQKKRSKGLFINSTYRRTGLLKTLLQGLQRGDDPEEIQDISVSRRDVILPPSSMYTNGEKGDGTQIRKVASL